MITKKGKTITFCCEVMRDKVFENHIQMILTGGGHWRVFSGSMGGWETRAERCPSMKFCPYCGERINESGRQG